MFKDFKKAGEWAANLFTTNPEISAAEKDNLEKALNLDAEALNSEALTAAQTQITELEGKLQAATDADAAKDALMTELEGKLTASGASMATLQTEHDALEAEVTAFREKIHGKKAGDKKGDSASEDEGETLAEEIERLKAEHPYSLGGLEI